MDLQHNTEQNRQAFGRLLKIMDELREQCPWDRKQTFASLRKLTIEETYELADAILEEDLEGIREEVGDIMLHLVFYARIAAERGAWNIADALHAVCEKLIERHPHIYGDVVVGGEDDVKRNWEKLKLKSGKKSVLSGVPNSLPAMVKAFRMQEKTRQVGFEWANAGQVWDKVREEMEEFYAASSQPDPDPREVEEEFGDVLFSLINYARFKNIDPEAALARVNSKFKRRFEFIEAQADKDLSDMSLEEMDLLWERAKREERGLPGI